ncbi:MAG TPA: hypothetical protein VNZ52_12750 [Candidatus Thermoplasmatota archaeon]|nr:hypothetical protein [Candidatus Thermoplasmatota archaeon]
MTTYATGSEMFFLAVLLGVLPMGLLPALFGAWAASSRRGFVHALAILACLASAGYGVFVLTLYGPKFLEGARQGLVVAPFVALATALLLVAGGFWAKAWEVPERVGPARWLSLAPGGVMLALAFVAAAFPRSV